MKGKLVKHFGLEQEQYSCPGPCEAALCEPMVRYERYKTHFGPGTAHPTTAQAPAREIAASYLVTCNWPDIGCNDSWERVRQTELVKAYMGQADR